MEATMVLVLLLVFLVGGMMLALAMGYREIEESRAAAPRVETAAAESAAAMPSFFARPQAGLASRQLVAVDAALLARLERHVKAEHEMVAEFVHFPSVERLHRRSTSSLHVH